jgi:hypothetical protein
VIHCVHCQFLYCATKPPRKGPRDGPRKGAIRKKPVALALSRGGNISARVPPPTAKTGLPVVPAKNRHTSSEANVFEKPAPKVKSAHIGRDTLYTICRPKFSEIGEAIMGPQASPRTYKVTPRRAAVGDTSNLSAISLYAGEYTEDPNVLEGQLAHSIL